MTNSAKSPISESGPLPESAYVAGSGTRRPPLDWVKVGAIAAASAALGGLAAAWFYRNTLSQLREAAHGTQDSPPNVTENETEEDF